MDERMLYEKKWHDYRLLSPEGANFVFLQEFIAAYRAYSEIRRGTSYINPLSYKRKKKDPETGKPKTTSVSVPVAEAPYRWPSWKVLVELRQWADSRGMKYDNFWAWAFKATIECRHRFFAINYCKSKCVLGKIAEYAKESKLIPLSKLPLFKPENYRGFEAQNDYYWYIVSSVREKYLGEYVEKLRTAAEDGLISWDFLQTFTKEFKEKV